MIPDMFDLKHYDYELLPELIAQRPVEPRDACRLLLVDRRTSSVRETVFRNVRTMLSPGDVLVVNNTEVFRARLDGVKPTGARIEILLLRHIEAGLWEALANPAKRVRPNDTIVCAGGALTATVEGVTERGTRLLRFEPQDIIGLLPSVGKVPLPPYIKQELHDLAPYQTVYARRQGAVAAPTAGLHFTRELLDELQANGIHIVSVTLHCGLATFRPVKIQDIRLHPIEEEWIEISEESANVINAAKRDGKKVIAVGTTSVRVLESRAAHAELHAYSGWTDLYITPGYRFRFVDGLITNFHTPCSSNLILVAAFAGLALTHQSYAYAREQKMRFYSFGDAMFIR